MKTYSNSIIVSLCLLLFSCSPKKSEETSEVESNDIQISKAQFASEKMAFGSPEIVSFDEVIRFTGSIIPDVEGSASISLPFPGTVKRIHCRAGEFVSKGQVMFVIAGNELIDLQKDLAESSALLKRLKMEFERARELNKDNIGSKKDFTLAESAFNMENARYSALKIKLENIGLRTSEIENGSFYSTYSLRAPMEGYVTELEVKMGNTMDTHEVMAEIIDPKHFQLKLEIFEKDIHKLSPKQAIRFKLSSNANKMNIAELSFVGQTVDQNRKTIYCYADIHDVKTLKAYNNQFVEGTIAISSDSVPALPETAIISSENADYVLSLLEDTDEAYTFSKTKIQTGRNNSGYTELVGKDIKGKILVEGVYNLILE